VCLCTANSGFIDANQWDLVLGKANSVLMEKIQKNWIPDKICKREKAFADFSGMTV
jgi:hypothetical protein